MQTLDSHFRIEILQIKDNHGDIAVTACLIIRAKMFKKYSCERTRIILLPSKL